MTLLNPSQPPLNRGGAACLSPCQGGAGGGLSQLLNIVKVTDIYAVGHCPSPPAPLPQAGEGGAKRRERAIDIYRVIHLYEPQ